jgi:hypothetical protein
VPDSNGGSLKQGEEGRQVGRDGGNDNEPLESFEGDLILSLRESLQNLADLQVKKTTGVR